jgi:hypothetical protein
MLKTFQARRRVGVEGLLARQAGYIFPLNENAAGSRCDEPIELGVAYACFQASQPPFRERHRPYYEFLTWTAGVREALSASRPHLELPRFEVLNGIQNFVGSWAVAKLWRSDRHTSRSWSSSQQTYPLRFAGVELAGHYSFDIHIGYPREHNFVTGEP